MSAPALTALVLLAGFGACSLLLSVFAALLWRMILHRTPASSADLLALRLLPAAGSALLTLAVLLPAFSWYEPAGRAEEAGPWLIGLALFSLAVLGAGITRAYRAYMSSHALLRTCQAIASRDAQPGQAINIVDIEQPVVAVVGGIRPRIIAAQRVIDVCSDDELRQVIAHEQAHVRSCDNLKLLLCIASPDPLAWIPAGADVIRSWRSAAESEADERAVGENPQNRLALASAIIKVARLASGSSQPLPALSIQVASDDVEGRVRRLLGKPYTQRARILRPLAAVALIVPLIAVPFYAQLHDLLEALVELGR